MMNLEGDFESFSARSLDGTIVLTVPEDANAFFNANTEIEGDGLELIREDENSNLWRLGKGGTTYKLNVNDGKVVVRCASLIKTVWQ